jgi:hypothetical protein
MDALHRGTVTSGGQRREYSFDRDGKLHGTVETYEGNRLVRQQFYRHGVLLGFMRFGND